jgi:hypothetical protein
VIGRPTAGVRLEVEMARGSFARPGADSVVAYRGFVFTPDADLPIELSVEMPSGGVRARIDVSGWDPQRISELERMAAALVRSATKAAGSSGHPLPRKIVRWRP